MPIQATLHYTVHSSQLLAWIIISTKNRQAGLGAGSALAFGKFWTKIMTGFFESVSMDNVGDMWGLIIVPLSVDIMLISPLKRKLTKKINNDEQNNNMYTTKYILIFYTCPSFQNMVTF